MVAVIVLPKTARQGTSSWRKSVDERLELVGIGAQHRLPVADDDVLVHVVGFEHQ
jgi:hypothetical protein